MGSEKKKGKGEEKGGGSITHEPSRSRRGKRKRGGGGTPYLINLERKRGCRCRRIFFERGGGGSRKGEDVRGLSHGGHLLTPEGEKKEKPLTPAI